MEPESPGTRSGNTRNENAAQAVGSRQKRRSTGNNSPKSKRVHRGRHSWHDTSQTEHGYATRRKSLDVSLRKSEIDESDESPRKEEDLCKKTLRKSISKDGKQQKEEDLCKKTLQETILKLNKDVDVQACTLLDLVNQISSLAEEKDDMVKKLSTKVAEDEEKIVNLEEILTERKIEIDSLSSEKNKFELLVKEEQDKFIRVENQLREALAKAEKFSREVDSYVSKIIHDSESLPHQGETTSLSEEDVCFKTERYSMPLEEEDDMDLLLKNALSKIAALVDENKNLEREVHSYENSKIYWQKLNERFTELEEKLTGYEAVCFSKQLSEKSEVLVKQFSVNEVSDNKMSEQEFDGNEIVQNQNKNEDNVSIEEQICSKIKLLERLNDVSEFYRTKFQQEIGRNEELSSKINKLDELFEELKQAISDAQMENDNLIVLLEREKQKFSSLELALAGKDKELEALKQKGQFTDIENEVKELIKRVAVLNAEKLEAEEKEYKAQFEIKTCKDKLSELKLQLDECQRKVLSLTSSNEQLQQMVNSEKHLSEDLKGQLQIALENVESLTKDITEMSDKFRSKEEELLKRINDETSKILEMGDEIHSKTQALENISVIMEEHKLQLEEERSNNKSLVERLSNLIEKESCEERVHSVYQEDVEEMIVLKDKLENCHFHLSKVNPENDCNERNDLGQNILSSINFQLRPILETMKDISYKMSKLSERLKEKVTPKSTNTNVVLKDAEFQPCVNLENIKEERLDMTASEFVEVNLCEQVNIKQERLSYGEMTYTEDTECSETHTNTSLPYERMLDTTTLVDLQGKILSLEEELAKTRKDLDQVLADRNEFELLLSDEAGKAQDYEKELKNALNEIDMLSNKISEAKLKEENISAELMKEIEKCKQLEDELEASEVVVANLAESEEECILQLKEMIESKMSLEVELQKARETIANLCEESEKLKSEIDTDVRERKTSELSSKEEISRLEALTQVQRQAFDEVHKEKEKIALEVSTYKERIAELEKTIKENMSTLSRLDAEKRELETLLGSEKENYQKASLQLSESSAHHDDMTSRISEYVTKLSELQEIVMRNESVITSLGAEKAELYSSLILERERVQKMSSESNESLTLLESLMEKTSMFENMVNETEILAEKIAQYEKEISNLKEIETRHEAEIASLGTEKARLEYLLSSENETNQSLVLQVSEASENLEKLSVKIQEYERKVLESEEVIIANESAMFKLTSEKEELESKLVLERENSLKLASQLSSISSGLESTLRETNDSCVKTDAEELASLLYTEIQKVEKLEKEVEMKKEELVYMRKREQELMMLLDGEKCRNKELEEKSLKVKVEVTEGTDPNQPKSPVEKEKTTTEGEAGKLINLNKKVLELEDVIVRLHIDKEELESILVSEKGNSRRMSSRLSEALLNLENISKELTQFSDKSKEVEKLCAELESKAQEIGSLKSDIQKKERDCDELREKLEQLKPEEMDYIPEYERKISELEEVIVANEYDYAKVCVEKKELESLLASERENQKKTGKHLSEALATLDSISAAMMNSPDSEEISRLEEKLRVEKDKVENLNNMVEDLTAALLQEKSKHEELQKILNSLEEETSIKSSLIHSNLEEEFCNHATSLEKITAYERKIVELEDAVSNHASEISKLCGEKVELESLLAQEKESRRKIYSELNVALINLDNVAERINEQAACNKDAKELYSLLENEMQKVKKLEEQLENKEEDVENLANKLDELSGRLREEKSRQELLGVNVPEGLAKEEPLDIAEERTKETMTEKLLPDNEATFNKEDQVLPIKLNETIASLENAMEIIKGHQKVIEELTEHANKNSIEISRLCKEKEEVESQLKTEKEKHKKTCDRLSEALAGIHEASGKVAAYEKRINQQIEMSEKNASEISKVFSENRNIEYQTIMEQEQFRNLSMQYNEAVVKLEIETAKLTASEKLMEEMKALADLNAHKVSRLEEGKVELESKLHLEKENLKNTSLQLKEALSSVKTQSEILLSYETTIDRLKDLADVNASEMAKLVKDKQKIELQLAAQQDKYIVVFNQLSKTSTDLENVSSKITDYEKMMEEMKISMNMKASEILRVSHEKSELEVLLELEKENLQKASFQLSETVIDLENESAKALAYEKLVEEMKVQLDSYSSEITALQKEKGEFESKWNVEKEKYQNESLQLNEALSTLNSESEHHEQAVKEWKDMVEMKDLENNQLLQANLEMEYQLNQEKEKSQLVSHQLSEALSNLDKETAKYEKLSEDWKNSIEVNASEIPRLYQEKNELELQLKEEREKLQTVSAQLNTALCSLENESTEYAVAMKAWMDTTENNTSEISSLLKEKNELELQLNSEKEKLQRTSQQLSEALVSLEKESTIYQKTVTEWKDAAEVRACEILRLIQEKKEIEQLLNDEREKLQKVSDQLHEVLGNIETLSSKHETVVKELKDTAEMNASEISRLNQEKDELELQLVHEKDSLKKVTDQLNEALAVLQSESANYEKIVREWKDAAEMRACEISRLCQEKDEVELLLEKEREELQGVSNHLNEALSNLKSLSSEYEIVVKEMKDAANISASEISRLDQEKKDIELQLNEEKESLKNVSVQLYDALTALGRESAKYEQVVKEWKDVAEMRACETLRLIQEKNELELLLDNERERLQSVSDQLSEALGNIKTLSSKHVTVVKELKDAAEMNASEISRLNQEKDELELQLVHKNDSLKNVTDQLNEAVAALQIESTKYEHAVREWKDAAEMRACEIRSLCQQKDDIESHLKQEKEHFENASMQLKEAELSLENLSSKISENEGLIKQLKEQCEIYSSEVSNLRLEKEETEAQLIMARENGQTVATQLNEALLKLESESSRVSTCERCIEELKELADVNASEISRLTKEKEEIESQVMQEKKNSHELSKQLSEALVTIEDLTRELNFSYSNDKKAEELSSLLKAETQKVKQMEEELTIKDEKFREYQDSQSQLLNEARNKVAKLEKELERVEVQSEEYILEIQSQKAISESKDVEIKDLFAKITSHEGELKRLSDMEKQAMVTVSDHVATITELELLIKDAKNETSILVSRSEELESQLHLERENSQKLNLHLQDALVEIDSLSKEIKNLTDVCNNKEEEIRANKSAAEKLAEKYNWQMNEESRWFEVVDKELDQYLMQISCLHKEKNLLVAEQEEKSENWSKELERLMALIENSESQLSTVTAENEELKVKIEEKGARLVSIQDQLDSALQEIENITHKLSELSSELERSQKNESETFKAMKSELESAKCALSESCKTEKELTNLLEMEKNKVEELKAQQSEIECARENLACKNQELTESMNAVNQQLQSVIKDYEKSSENELKLMDTNEKLSADFELQKNRLSSYELEINRLEAELSAKSSENQELESKTKGIAGVMESLEILVKECKSQLSLVSSERDRLDEDLQLKDVQLRDVQNQLTNSQQEVEDIKVKLEEVSINLKNEKEEGSSIIKSLREELEATKYALSVCAIREEEVENALKAEKDRVNSLTKQISEEQSKMEELSSKNLELNNTLKCVNENLSAALEEKLKLGEREQNQKIVNEEMLAEVEKLKAASESELASLREELLAKADTMLALENRNLELLKCSASLKDEVNQGRSEINTLREENNNLVVMVDSKSKQAESVLEQLNSAQLNIDTLKKQLEEITNQLEANKMKESEKIHYLQSELADAKLSLDARAKQEDQLNILLIAEKNKADELNRKLKEEMFRYEAAADKNKELTTSIQMLEQQLTVFLDESKTRNEKEASHLATINELNEKIKALEDESYSTKLMNENLKAEIQVKCTKIIVSEKNNSELSSLVEAGNRKIAKLEVSMKEMNEKLMSKEATMAQMQIALEKAESKASSLASEADLLKKHKESENLLRGKVSQLEGALREAKDSMKKMAEANVIELEKVKKISKENILEMKEKVSTISRELIDVKKTSEIRISTLQKEIKLEKERSEKKAHELAAMEISKTELSKELEQAQNKAANLDLRLAKEREKTGGYEQKLENAKAEIRKRTLEIHRMKAVEKELKSHLEIGRKKAVVVEGELAQVRASLLSSNLKQDELKSEILNLEAKVQQEAAFAKQLSMQLEMERIGQESAKEADKKLLQVIATQERELALLKSGSSNSEPNAEVQLLKCQAEDKDRQIEVFKKELMRCKQLIYGGAKGHSSGIVQQTKKADFGVQTTLGESKSQAPEVHLLHKKIKQLENDKEFLKELCKRRHKQREDLKKELAALSGQSTSKAQPENKENVNLNA